MFNPQSSVVHFNESFIQGPPSKSEQEQQEEEELQLAIALSKSEHETKEKEVLFSCANLKIAHPPSHLIALF